MHDYFAGLLDGAVNINPDRLRQLDEHVAAIKDCLRGDDDLASIVRSFLPQGSWAQRTIIRPLPGMEFDADLLVAMHVFDCIETAVDEPCTDQPRNLVSRPVGFGGEI